MRSEFPLTVYFDASCPVCRSEILGIKVHDAGGHLHLVACSATGFDVTSFRQEGVTVTDMMTRLHARDRPGAGIRGAAAIELIYRTAGMQRMVRLWAPGDNGISMMKHFWPHLWIGIVALLIIVPPALILRARTASPTYRPSARPC